MWLAVTGEMTGAKKEEEMADVYIASAFSKDNSGGNKAGVLVQDYGLTESGKKELAGRLGYSETAFVSQSQCADYKIEYFTPEGEVPLCGHATIATFVVLNSLNLLGESRYFIETGAGILEIGIDKSGMVFMEQNNPVFSGEIDPSVLEPCFDTDVIDAHLPIQIVSTGLRDILIPVDTPEHLREAEPDFRAMSEISRAENVIGMHAFSLVNERDLTAVCRNFAPLYGIDEESATGTSNCALACYLFHHGQRQAEYIFEQGHNLDNVSQIVVRLESKQDEIIKASVGGYGYLTDRLTLHL